MRFTLGILFLVSAVQAAVPISWEQALAQARAYHPDLLIAQEEVIQSQQSLSIARSAQGPEVSAQARVGTSHASDNSTDSSSISLTAHQTLFDGGQLRAATAQSRSQLSSAQASLQLAQVQLLYRLRTAYIRLWQAQQNIQLSQAILQLRRTNADLISLRYRAGTEHKGALLSAQAKLLDAQAALSRAQRDIADAQAVLAAAIGLPTVPAFSATELPALPQLPSTPADFSALAKSHPSYRVLLYAQEISYQSLRAKAGDRWPEVSLSLSAGQSSNDIPPSDSTLSANLNLTYNLFGGDNRSAQIQRARSAYRAAQHSTLSGYNTLYTTLQNTYSAWATATDDAAVQQAYLQAALERNRIAQAQYSVGLTTYDSWTIIEDNYVAAQKQNLSAIASAHLAWAAWMQASATLYE